MSDILVPIFNGIVGTIVILVALWFSSALSIFSQRRAVRLLLTAGSFFVFTELLAGISNLWSFPSPEWITLLDEISDLTIIIFFGLATYLLYKSDLTDVTHLRFSANTDQMTGLHNYSFFRRTALRRFDVAQAYNLPLTCLLIDVDDFKDYNDRYGHEAGNDTLQCVAKVLQELSRADDLVARYGGEEFVMLLAVGSEDVGAMAERLRSGIESGCVPEHGGSSLREPITVSVGVASLSGRTRTLEDLVEAADQQMYHAKRAGKNRVASGELGH